MHGICQETCKNLSICTKADKFFSEIALLKQYFSHPTYTMQVQYQSISFQATEKRVSMKTCKKDRHLVDAIA